MKREKGYTREQVAKHCRLSVRTLDRYLKKGLIKGRKQFVPGHGYMRVFTFEEMDQIETIRQDQELYLAPGLRKDIQKRRERNENNNR